MKMLGLTGGIGSGKTVVAELLQMMGFPVYDSDTRAKILYDTDEDLKKKIIDFLGSELYSNGLLNRSLLAQLIFNDEKILNVIEALVHPAVERDFKNWIEANSHFPVLVQETAILFEAGLESLFDRIICVTAPEDIRIQRVCRRSGLNPAAVKERMNNQMSEDERIIKSDIIIVNDDIQPLIPQVKKIVQTLSLIHNK